MNNSKQKNIIYGNDYKRVLPYSSKDGECLDFTQNSNITDFSINNVFQQLINNDLFIENQLLVDSQYSIGPLMISSETQLSALPDGTKAWSNTEDVTLPLQIVKKTEIPLSSCFDLSASQSVYFIVPVGDSVFVGTSDGLFVDGVGGLSECLDNNNHKIIAYSYHVTPNYAFFATRSSIYRLNIGFKDDEYVYSFNEISDLNRNLSSICSIAFDEASKTMYVASAGENSQNSTLAYSVLDLDNTEFSDWNFNVRFSSDGYSQSETYRGYISSDIAVNSMTSLKKTNYSARSDSDDGWILAATNKGVFRSHPMQYVETKHVRPDHTIGELISMVSFSGKLYALFKLNESSNYKLYRCSGGDTVMTEFSLDNITIGSGKLKVCGDKLYLTQSTGIYMINTATGRAVLEYSGSNITNMDSAVIGNRPYIFIINKNDNEQRLCYYINQSDSDFHLDAYSLSDIGGDETVKEIAIGQGCGEWNNTIYIRTVSSVQHQKVYAYFIKFSPGASLDYSQIFRFDEVQGVSGCRKIIVGGDVCYYAYGTKISDGAKEIDIRRQINDIFYVDGASPYIIAATQNGVYKIDTGLNFEDLIGNNSTDYDHIADTSNMLCFSKKGNPGFIGYIDKKDVKTGAVINSMPMQNVKDIIGSGDKLYMLGDNTDVSCMTEYVHGDVIEKNTSPSCWHIFELDAPADVSGNSAILGLADQTGTIDTESSHSNRLYSLSVDNSGRWEKTVVACGDSGNSNPIHAAHSMNNTVFLARLSSISRFELPYNDQGYVDLTSLSQSDGWSNYGLTGNVKSIINTTLPSQSDPAVYISINDKVLKYQTGEYALNNEILSNYTVIPPLSRMLAWEEEQDSSLSNIIVGIISAEPKLHILRQKINNNGPVGQPISATVKFSDLSAAGSGLSTLQVVLSYQQTFTYNIEKELSAELGDELSEWTGQQISDAILAGPISVWLSSVISSKFSPDRPPIYKQWLSVDGAQSWWYTNINEWRYNSISKSGNHVIADFSYQLSRQSQKTAQINNYSQKDITPYDIIYDGNTKIYMLYTAMSVNCTSVWYELNPDRIADPGQMKYSYEHETHQYVAYFDYDEIMGFNGQKQYQISSYRDCGVIQEHDVHAKVLADEYNDEKSLFVMHYGDGLSVATFKHEDPPNFGALSRINGSYNYSFDLYKSNNGTWYIAAFKKNGTTLNIDLYQCDESGNTTKEKTLALNNFNLDKISTDIFIKDISINGNSINSINVLVCDYENNKLYSCFVSNTVDFSAQQSESLDLVDVRRFLGSNNIKGFRGKVVKDMTTSQRYLLDKPLNAVYSVDKTFVQAADNKIYSIGGYAAMQFDGVQLFDSDNSPVQNAGTDFKLHKVQSDIYLTVWQSSESVYDIYKMQPDGDFKWFSKIPTGSTLIFISVFKQNVNGVSRLLAVSRKNGNDPVLLWNIKENGAAERNCEFDQITSAYRSVDVKYSQYGNRLKEIIKRASQALDDYYAPFWFRISSQKEIFLNFQQLNQRIFNKLTLEKNNTNIRRFENELFNRKKYGVSVNDSGVSLLEIPGLNSFYTKSGASDLFTTDNRKFYLDESGAYYQENAESVYVQLPMPSATTNLSCIKHVPDEYWYMTDQDGNLYKSVDVEYYPSQISAYGTVSYNGDRIENAMRIVGNNQFTGVVTGGDTSSDMLLFTPEYVESLGSLSVQASPLQCRGYENPNEYTVSIFQTHGDFSKAIAYTYKDNVYLLNIQAEFGRANADKITHSQVNDYLSSCQQVLQCGNARYYYLRSKEDDIILLDITSIDGIVMKPVNKRMYSNSVSARSFCQIGENEFLVNTDKGLYRYTHTGGLATVTAVTVSSYNIGSVALYNFGDGLSGYLFSDVSTVYESSNYRVWKPKFQLSCGNITAMYPKNTHDWYIGSTSGLYVSSYKYKVDVDISKISEQDIYNIYKDLISCEISSAVADLLSGHEEDDSRRYGHTGDAIVKLLNDNIVSVDFSGLSVGEWPATQEDDKGSLSGANNDLVLEQYWGDAGALSSVLSVYTENRFVSADCADAEYFIRRWKSGVAEMYIHVPTTNTYYVNHLPSTPGYSTPSCDLTAMNVLDFGSSKAVFNHDPNEVYTNLRLSIDKQFAQIDYVIGVYANGNSLPLRIYKDTNSNLDVEPAQFFNSYVAPTVYTGRTDDSERYIFNFACFGADEQAIKIFFIEKTA